MSYPVWPRGLVQFERSAWQSQPQDGRRRSQTDVGPPRFRRGISKVARRKALSLVLSRADLATFWRFHDEDCDHGSGLFWMPDPGTDGWKLLTGGNQHILTSAGQPILLASRMLCAWGDEPPVETIKADTDFRVSFSVWVMP